MWENRETRLYVPRWDDNTAFFKQRNNRFSTAKGLVIQQTKQHANNFSFFSSFSCLFLLPLLLSFYGRSCCYGWPDKVSRRLISLHAVQICFTVHCTRYISTYYFEFRGIWWRYVQPLHEADRVFRRWQSSKHSKVSQPFIVSDG